MRLQVTDHAFVRMADWHPDLRQFVPTRFPLDAENAQRALNGLHVFVAGLERGRPCIKPQDLTQTARLKYPVTGRPFLLYDWELEDFYRMGLDRSGLTLITVTAIKRRDASIIDEPRPVASFRDVDEIRLPYPLAREVDRGEFRSLVSPSGREIAITFSDPLPENVRLVRDQRSGDLRRFQS